MTAALATSGGDITAANGTLVFNAPLNTAGGTLGGGTGVLLLKNGLTISANTAMKGPLQTTSLTLGGSSGNWTTGLDLQNAPLILEPTAATKATALATLQDQLTAGASTHSVGVFSSTLQPNMTIVLLDNATWNQSTFRGAALDPNSLLAIPAAFGDATLDGAVDLNDLNTVLNNLGTATTLWTSGNFDGAPTIDLNDLNDVLNSLGTSYATSSTVLAAEALVAATPTPEPASLATGAGHPAALTPKAPCLTSRALTQRFLHPQRRHPPAARLTCSRTEYKQPWRSKASYIPCLNESTYRHEAQALGSPGFPSPSFSTEFHCFASAAKVP